MTAHARIVKAQPVTVATLARQMLTEANGDLTKATDKLVGYVSNFPALADEILRIGARKLINEVPVMDRKAATAPDGDRPFIRAPHRMNAGARAAKERLVKRAVHLRNSLLSMPYVINGMSKPLGDWLGVEIEAYGETQLMAGTTQIRNARFAIAVGRAAGHKKIGYALKEDDIARMHEEALNTDV